MRWEPLHELVVWQSRATRLRGADSSGWAPSTDLYETSDAFCIAIELPGFKPGEFDLQATEQGVTITGQRQAASVGAPGQFLHVERGQGAFSRRFQFPHPVVVSEISATFRDGLLAVRAPKKARAVAAGQRITVES
jgi:HSP20 family protein